MSKSTWFEADGDNTLALDWKIDEHSIVWEIGGFEGRWAAQIQEKYNPNIFIFEPQKWAYEKMHQRFHNTKAHVFPFGVWTNDTILKLYEHDTDGASVVKIGGRTMQECNFADIYKILKTDVDVCLMNIEGGEFVLIPYMIGLNLTKRFRYFWCQFHPGVIESGKEKTELIYEGLSKSHRVMWDYYPTAVAWERI